MSSGRTKTGVNNMSEADDPAAPESGDSGRREAWQPVLLLFPRFAILMTRSGAKRQMLWPGAYERRRSRSLNGMIYRARR
jgi:hypothetical protein